MSSDYIWPLSKSTTPNEMNTSFGPRINNNRWDFHDGIDLPACIGTKVYAMRGGTVHFAGLPGDPGAGRYDSRHVMLKVDDPKDGWMYLVYLHLDSIDGAVTSGANIVQGQEIGIVGEHKATYPHLHIEFLLGTTDADAQTSRHPLKYLPYSNMKNFTVPVVDRFNRLESKMAARLLFDGRNKSEGDLLRIEVDLLKGTDVLATRVVDFHDETTINKKRGNSDKKIFMNDIGVEGYQKSRMNDPQRPRIDLRYGILVRNILDDCDTLIARVFDIGGNVISSAPISVPNQKATNELVSFEDGAMPPAGWELVTSTTGSGTTVTNDTSAAYSGRRSMRCINDPATETSTQRAGIEFKLPPGRFEWIAEGWFNPIVLDLAAKNSIQLLRFQTMDENLSVAARIYSKGGKLLAGIVANDSEPSNSSETIVCGLWRKWRLHLLRVGTRETTAILYLDKDGILKEQDRLNWDSTAFEPQVLRTGIGRLSAGGKAAVLVDELWISEYLIS